MNPIEAPARVSGKHLSSIPATPRRGRIRTLLAAAFLAVSGLHAQASTPLDPVFRPGDALTLSAPFDTASVLNGSYPIDSLGYVEIPMVGKTLVGGRSRQEVQAQLSKQLSEYLRDANIIVRPTVRITFLGHWVNPGMYYMDPDDNLWDIFRAAGGPAGETTLDELKVQRGHDFPAVDLLGAFSQGKSFRAAGLRSGDIIVLPVPSERDAWYWFRESIALTAQLGTVVSTLLTAYVTYLIYESSQDQN